MGPRDRPRPLPDGAACTACGAPVPIGAIRIGWLRDIDSGGRHGSVVDR
ncbi:MAG TPA: hypothetical protein VIL81_00625 [Candidatus Limnocylindrales bacterium]